MLSFACLLCRESRGAFDMCLIQQSFIFHSKKCYTKESHSLVKSTFLTLHSLHYHIHIYFIVIQYQKTSEQTLERLYNILYIYQMCKMLECLIINCVQ